MKISNNKQIIVIAIVAVIVIVTIGLYFYKSTNENEKIDYSNVQDSTENDNFNEDNEENKSNKILIHVTGAVKSQGIVILKENSRIMDAIEAAGGEREDADLEKLNLAYILQDGEKLYVPSKNEKENKEYVSTESGNNVIIEGANNEKETQNNMININTATKEQLITLDGVGEATANKIIKYREEKGKFGKIDDIKNVPGIGDAKFENIKDKISVK